MERSHNQRTQSSDFDCFRIEEKKYKKYKNITTDFTDVVDFYDICKNTLENREIIESVNISSKHTIFGLKNIEGTHLVIVLLINN